MESVNHPQHYGGDGPYEVFKVAEAWGFWEDAALFNVLKYIARAGKKDELTELKDLEKAEVYLIRKINKLKEAAELKANSYFGLRQGSLSELTRDSEDYLDLTYRNPVLFKGVIRDNFDVKYGTSDRTCC